MADSDQIFSDSQIKRLANISGSDQLRLRLARILFTVALPVYAYYHAAFFRSAIGLDAVSLMIVPASIAAVGVLVYARPALSTVIMLALLYVPVVGLLLCLYLRHLNSLTIRESNGKPGFLWASWSQADRNDADQDSQAITEAPRTAPFESIALATIDAQEIAEANKLQLRYFFTHDFGRASDSSGRSLLMTRDDAMRVVHSHLASPKPYQVFVGTARWLGEESPPEGTIELVFIGGTDKSDIVRSARTNGLNHGITTADIVDKIADLDRRYGVAVIEASTDTLGLTLLNMPADLNALAVELEAFCPDLVAQGFGTSKALEDALRRSEGSIVFWWD